MSYEFAHGSLHGTRFSRRSLIGGVSAAIAATAIGRSADAHPEPIDEGRTYATTLADGVYLAIVVSAREAFAFVTDGAGRADYFTGQSSRSMTLIGANDARLTASVDGDGFEGRVVNADGSAFTFHAPMASGVTGLYAVEISEGYATGVSNSGCRLLAGTVSNFAEGGTLMHGIVTGERHGSCPIMARVSPASWGRQFWIIQDDGVLAGGCSDNQGFGFAHTSGNVG